MLQIRVVAISLVCAGACTPTLSQPRGDAHLEAMAHGTRAYHHGRFDEARAAYANAAEHAERRVDRDEALYREAKTLQRLGRDAEALPLLDQLAVEEPPSRRTGRSLYDAGRIRLRMHDDANALRNFQAVVLRFPDHGISSRALVRVLEMMPDGPVRDAWLNEALSRVGTHDIGDDILSTQATLALEHGDRARARALWERIVEEHPYPVGQRWDDALWRLADLDELEGNPAAAAQHLERMLSLLETTTTPGSYTLPRFPAAMLRLGILFRDSLHDRARAIATFERLRSELRFSTLRDDALLEIAVTALQDGDVPRACEALSGVLGEFEVGRARRRAAELQTQSCPDVAH